jgi:molybdopterin molybdotransferase
MSMLNFDQALQHLLDAAIPVVELESLPIEAALGRVLATPQHSAIHVPPLDNSAMDGYAVCADDVLAAGTRLPVSQRIPAGSIGHALARGTAARIFTGAPVPAGATAVVMQELCAHAGDAVTINHVPSQGENIRRAGEDIATGAEVLPGGTRLTPQALGLLASVGIAQVPVRRALRVALFSTGDELVSPGEALRPGAIYNSNRYLLRGALEQLGCEVTDLGIVADTLEATRAALRRAAEHDLIVTSGGVSVGEEDHVKPAVQAEGELNLWKIAIKPGKPLAFGRVGQAAFIGVPGNPVAAFVTFALLVAPYIRKRQGQQHERPKALRLAAGFNWKKPDPRRNFLRARIADDGRLELFRNQGSGVLTSTVWAEGLVDVAPDATIAPGDVVSFIPFTHLLG